jgi:hypothetical protein
LAGLVLVLSILGACASDAADDLANELSHEPVLRSSLGIEGFVGGDIWTGVEPVGSEPASAGRRWTGPQVPVQSLLVDHVTKEGWSQIAVACRDNGFDLTGTKRLGDKLETLQIRVYKQGSDKIVKAEVSSDGGTGTADTRFDRHEQCE